MRALLPLLLLGTTLCASEPADAAVAARKARRVRLAAAIGSDYALLLGQPLTDVLQPPQEGHLLYLTGVEEPDASLLLAGKQSRPIEMKAGGAAVRAREVLFLRDAPETMARFLGLRLRPDAETARALGVELARAAPAGGAGLARQLAQLLPKGAGLRLPRYGGADAVTLRPMRDELLARLAKERPDLKILELDELLGTHRAIKDLVEQAALRRALDITAEALREAVPRIRPGILEAEIHGVLLAGVRARGAWPAFPFVVGSGAKSAIPHHFRNDGTLRDGDLLVIDLGAAVERYAADVTRTFPVSGRFSPRQREVYEVVLRAQLAAIAVARPGATFGDIDRAARQVIAEAKLGRYFIHATSHHVGLDVHDPGPTRLEPGMTFTIEPGVYLGEEGFGIRIEDLLLVTERGVEILSSASPKEPDAIEAWMRGE
ncbi:MAG: aminopeptidase P N-terminal domain-containing protein [Planctomycetaceae bacterium]